MGDPTTTLALKKILLISACSFLLFVACRHENNIIKPKENYEDSILLTSTDDSIYYGETLQMIVSSNYQYDNAGRLASWRSSSYHIAEDDYYSQKTDFIRDEKERVVRTTRNNYGYVDGKSLPMTPALITEFHYAGESENVLFCYQYQEGNEVVKGDSITFTYSGSRITGIYNFRLWEPYPRYAYTGELFTYDNEGHLLSFKGPPQDALTTGEYTYRYDDKINPLQLGPEVLVGDALRISTGNPVSRHSIYSGSYNENVETTTYTYRDYDRPLRSITLNSYGSMVRSTDYGYSR